MRSKLKTTTPPKLDDKEKLNFISGADDNDSVYPWEQPQVRSDLKIKKDVKMAENYILKLKWLGKNTPETQEDIMRRAIYGEVDRLLKEINII